jgi:predicted metal-dependent phosphotriesterase family hydrolase
MDHLPWGVRTAQGSGPAILSWRQRADCIKGLADAGFASKIFLSNDWYFGISIAGTGTMEAKDKENPDGLLFNTRKTIPYLEQIGVTDQQVRTITVENPRNFFARR